MAKDPAFLFYPNDFIGGTMGMTLEEKGSYMELLMMQFNRGHMTSHMIGQTIGQNWDKIKEKFKIDECGSFYNERLEEEINKRKSFTASRKNNLEGKNQYSKKSEKKEGHMTSHMENENNIIILYNVYPQKCSLKNRSTGKCKKDKDKIRKLLSIYSFEQIKNVIESYVLDCENSKTYLKNFGTFLNNFPEPNTEQSKIAANRLTFEDLKPNPEWTKR